LLSRGGTRGPLSPHRFNIRKNSRAFPEVAILGGDRNNSEIQVFLSRGGARGP